MTLQKLLKEKLYESRWVYADNWSILHFLFFLFIGLIYPNKWFVVIVVMLLFEAFERIASTKVNFFKESNKDMFSDFGINIIGYAISSTFFHA